MVELYNISLIKGIMIGVEYEELDDEEYLIINLGLLQIILVW